MSQILISLDETSKLLQPILHRLEKIEEAQKLQSNSHRIFSDKEAAVFLRMSVKMLQTLRNKRMIGFVRHEYGRKILYTLEHLMDYLKRNEIKAKK